MEIFIYVVDSSSFCYILSNKYNICNCTEGYIAGGSTVLLHLVGPIVRVPYLYFKAEAQHVCEVLFLEVT